MRYLWIVFGCLPNTICISEYIWVPLSHILRLSAREFPYESISSPIYVHWLKYYLESGASLKTFCRHYVPSSKQQQRCSPITNYQSPHRVLKSKLRQCLFAKKWGLQSKPRLVCLLWGEGERRYELPITLWVPKSKPRLCLFAKKSVPPKQTKTLSVWFWESGGTSCPLPSGYPKVNQDSSVYFWESGDMSRLNDDAKSSVNTTSLSNASDIIRAISLPNATRPLNWALALTNYQLPITNYLSPIPPTSGTQK